MWRKENTDIVDGNVPPLWKIIWRFLKKLEVKLPYDPAIPLLGIYPDKTIVVQKTHAPLCSLLTIAKKWKQFNIH